MGGAGAGASRSSSSSRVRRAARARGAAPGAQCQCVRPLARGRAQPIHKYLARALGAGRGRGQHISHGRRRLLHTQQLENLAFAALAGKAVTAHTTTRDILSDPLWMRWYTPSESMALLLYIALVLSGAVHDAAAGPAAPRPHIVFIMIDGKRLPPSLSLRVFFVVSSPSLSVSLCPRPLSTGAPVGWLCSQIWDGQTLGGTISASRSLRQALASLTWRSSSLRRALRSTVTTPIRTAVRHGRARSRVGYRIMSTRSTLGPSCLAPASRAT